MADHNTLEPEDVGGGASLVISSGTPQALGTAAAGSTGQVSDAGHIHAHGNQSGGALHAAASGSSAGFMSSSDKTKLDGLVAALPIAEFRTIGSAVTSSRKYFWQNLNATGTNNSSTSTNLGRLKLPAGTYTFTVIVSSAVFSGRTITFSIYAGADLTGTYSAVSGSDIVYDDTTTANQEKSVTFTLASAAYVVFSGIDSSSTYLGWVFGQIRPGS